MRRPEDASVTLARIERLRRTRPINHTARVTAIGLGGLALLAWTIGGLFPHHLFEARTLDNLARFSKELIPYPLRESLAAGESLEWGALGSWILETLDKTRGLEAAWVTFNLALLAIALASLFAVFAAPFAARNLATRDPFGEARDSRTWSGLRVTARGGFVALRALPEYVLAFLLVAMLPWSAWPAVLALAIHNGGILARLQAESLESLPKAPLRAIHLAGATRSQVAWTAAMPLSLGRFLLYVFYRYETCIREATVLGLLGITTLGYVIQDARSKLFYDEMLLLIGLGVVLVLVADGASYMVRRYVARA